MLLIIFKKIVEFIFPIYCIGCGKDNEYLCFKCINKIEYSYNTTSADYLYAIFNYRNQIIKTALWNLKYKGYTSIAEPIARIMYDKILEELSELLIMNDFKNPILIPIPLSRKRFRERGFNQSEEIARRIYKIDEGRTLEFIPSALCKIRETESQMKTRNRAKRMKNLSGCFAVKNTALVSERNIILIDDITTTGATITEARNTLLSAGARKVIAFTVAH